MRTRMAWTVPSEQDDKRKETAKEENWKNRRIIRKKLQHMKLQLLYNSGLGSLKCFQKVLQTTLLLLLKSIKSPSTYLRRFLKLYPAP